MWRFLYNKILNYRSPLYKVAWYTGIEAGIWIAYEIILEVNMN